MVVHKRMETGDDLPTFRLKDQFGNWFDSGDLFGKPSVVFFYPKDNTPGCTREVCAFRDKYEDFIDLGARVVGISGDTVGSHEQFARKYKLPFPILSDPGRKVYNQFKIRGNLFNLIPGRVTFVFDHNSKLIHKFNSINAVRHMPEALETLKALNHD